MSAKFEARRSAGFQPDPEPGEEILVSVAASLKESMEALGAEYEKQTGTRVLYNFAGSSDIAKQIVATPKVDITGVLPDDIVSPLAGLVRFRLPVSRRHSQLSSGRKTWLWRLPWLPPIWVPPPETQISPST